MHKGILNGQPWQSCGLRKNGDRAILRGSEITWLSAVEFSALLMSEEGK